MRFLTDQRLVVVLLVTAWFECSLFPAFSVRFAHPNLFFIFLVFFAFRVTWKPIIQVAFVLGLARDLFSNGFFGLETASFTAAAILLQFLATGFDRNKPVIQAGSLFAFSWVAILCYLSLNLLVSSQHQIIAGALERSFWVAVYTTVVGMILFPFLEKWVKPIFRGKQYELF